MWKYVGLVVFLVGCDDHTFTGGGHGAEIVLDSGTDPEIMAGAQLIGDSCTSSCHNGQDMGERSSRFPDDAELVRVIRGEESGPMASNGWASDDWSEADFSNAIAYLRSIE